MNIQYKTVRDFDVLTSFQVLEIGGLLNQLSPTRTFGKKQLHTAMAHGWIHIASDHDREEGVVIGMNLVQIRHTALYSFFSVEDVVVDQSYRGHGIGRTLLDNAIIQMQSEGGGYQHIDLTSNPKREAANRLYESLGFELRHTNCYRLQLRG